jgi:hypothetical protein
MGVLQSAPAQQVAVASGRHWPTLPVSAPHCSRRPQNVEAKSKQASARVAGGDRPQPSNIATRATKRMVDIVGTKRPLVSCTAFQGWEAPMAEMKPTVEEQIAEVKAMLADLLTRVIRSPVTDPIVTRDEAAAMLKVSTRHLRKLVAAGRIVAQPSGIARDEVERYARTPQPPLPTVVSKAKRERTAEEEAERTRSMLKALHRKRGQK